VLNEFYQVTFRKKLYKSIEELQKDADEWIKAAVVIPVLILTGCFAIATRNPVQPIWISVPALDKIRGSRKWRSSINAKKC
jgi:hypothetical protein